MSKYSSKHREPPACAECGIPATHLGSKDGTPNWLCDECDPRERREA